MAMAAIKDSRACLTKALAGALLEHLGGFAADGPPFALEVEGGRRLVPGVRVGAGFAVMGGLLGGLVVPAMADAGVVLGLLGEEGVRPTLEHDGGPSKGVGRPPHVVVVGLLVEPALN